MASSSSGPAHDAYTYAWLSANGHALNAGRSKSGGSTGANSHVVAPSNLA
jgi:hypothetical protein